MCYTMVWVITIVTFDVHGSYMLLADSVKFHSLHNGNIE